MHPESLRLVIHCCFPTEAIVYIGGRLHNVSVSIFFYLVFTKQQCGEPVFCPRFNPRLTPAIAEANALAHSEQTNNCGGSAQRLKESLETIEKAQVLRAKNLLDMTRDQDSYFDFLHPCPTPLLPWPSDLTIWPHTQTHTHALGGVWILYEPHHHCHTFSIVNCI